MRHGGDPAEYREAMRRGGSLMWEERWEAAATAYRRALSARPDDPSAQRQLALALSRARGPRVGPSSPTTAPATGPARDPTSGPVERTTDGALLGRTLRGQVSELAGLPHDVVRTVVERLHAVERHQDARRYEAAFHDAFALLQQVPTFLPLHVLLAELYTETGQWHAAHAKLETVEAAYAVRAHDDSGAAAA